MQTRETAAATKIVPGGYREMLKVAYPLIVSMGSFSLMQFFDRVFLSRYSPIAIQAALPAGILSFLLLCGFMALAGYAGTFVAQYFGAGDKVGCSRSTAQGVLMSLMSWPLMLALIPVGGAVLRISGHDAEVLRQELEYFDILMLGGVAVPLGAAISGFFTGRGDTYTNMWAHIAGNVLNVVLDYLLIFGRLGFPEMGIGGAAWATIISGVVPPTILLVLYFSRRIDSEYDTRASFRLERRLFMRIARFGLPSAVHLVMDIGAFTLFILLTGRLGSTALVASNIALSINNLAFMPLIGLSIAASIIVGQHQGRGDSDCAQKAGWTALKLGLIYMALIATSFVVLPRGYMTLFTAKSASMSVDEILPVGRILLMMMAAWGLMDTANLILSGALKGAGDTRFVMYYSLALAWGIWITGELLILLVFGGGILAAWLWMMIYIMLMALGFIWRFRSGAWKKIELLEKQTPLQPNRTGADALTLMD